MSGFKRRIKIIRPRLQLKLVFVFLGMTLLALMLQFMVFMKALSSIAAELPADHDVLMEAIPEITLQSLLLTLGVVMPLVFLVGVLVTFRIAGPVYRFETYFKQLIRGENPGECRLRKGDELMELCELINQATSAMRQDLPAHAAHEHAPVEPAVKPERQAA